MSLRKKKKEHSVGNRLFRNSVLLGHLYHSEHLHFSQVTIQFDVFVLSAVYKNLTV